MPKIKCNIFDENILFNFAPMVAPINAPIAIGIAISHWTNPCDALRVELKSAFSEKQASDDPIAIFIGIPRKNVNAGTRIAPVPIPSNPGKIPAIAPIEIFCHNLPLDFDILLCRSDFFPFDSHIASAIILDEMIKNRMPIARSSHRLNNFKCGKISENTIDIIAPETITGTIVRKSI